MSKVLDANLKNPQTGDVLVWHDGYWRNTPLSIALGSASAAVLSPAAALSSLQTDNYAPFGINSARILRVVPNILSTSSLSGIQAPTFTQLLTISNVGNHDLVLLAENAGSLAANRFSLLADVTVLAGDSFGIYYDLVDARWRAL